jgi:hypothetical protein
MYLSRSRTGNIFPYRTVVVLRHHVYVPEFHDPSCYSVVARSMIIYLCPLDKMGGRICIDTTLVNGFAYIYLYVNTMRL